MANPQWNFDKNTDSTTKETHGHQAQGSTLDEKPWGQLAPKFLDLVASAKFLVAGAVQTVHTAFSSARRKSKDEKPYVKKPLMLHCFSFISFQLPVTKEML